MTQVTPIKPFFTEEGIELYATDSECGMSQNGLARFCGVTNDAVLLLIRKLGGEQNVPKMLESFVGQDLIVSSSFENGAKVYKSALCAAVCTYYAYESKAANDTARYSLAKFAAMGIDSWIRQTTGHAIAPAIDPAQLAIQLLLENKAQSEKITALHEVTIELQKEVLENERYMTKATLKAPGLQMLLDEAQYCSEGDRLPEQSGNVKTAYTLAEWLEEYKYPVPDKMYRQLRLAVAETFKSLRWYRPQKEDRYVEGKRRPAYVYKPEDFHYLDTCFSQVSASYRP